MTLIDLAQIAQDGASINQVPTWNGTNWVPSTPAAGSATGLAITMGANAYALTTTYTLVQSFGQAPFQLPIPGAGSYVVTCVVDVADSSYSDVISFQIYDTLAGAFIPGTIFPATISASGVGQAVLQFLYAATGATSLQVWGINSTAARGTVVASTPRIDYLTVGSESTYSLPAISSANPLYGASTTLTINGSGFTGATAVDINGTPCTAATVVNDTQITCTTPASFTEGPITVSAPGGTAATPGEFPPTGPASTHAYNLGGYQTSYVVTAYKFLWSSGAFSAISTANLSQAREYVAGASDSTSYGFSNGGYSSSGNVATSDRTTLSSDTSAANSATAFPTATYAAGAVASLTGYVFLAGGIAASSVTSNAFAIQSSANTISAASAAHLSAARQNMGVGQAGSKGYFIGGVGSGGGVATTDKLIFSTATTSYVSAANLPSTLSGTATCSDGASQCVTGGGSPTTNTMERTIWSTDTTTSISATLQASKAFLAAFSNGISGIFAGGSTNGMLADKFTFLTDTCAANSTADLATTTYASSAYSDVAL